MAIATLTLGERYNREQVHGIFAPDTDFTPQTGTWGLHGIVAIPDRPNDFVFFVTYGQSQGEHAFDEGVTDDGVLSWQSQPSQRLNSPKIQTLIDHNELHNTIYLFLREDRRGPYTYLGRLGYLSHDASREQPVYFQWQLLDWDALPVASRPSTTAAPAAAPATPTEAPAPLPPGTLAIDTAPPAARSRAVDQPTFRARKAPDYAARDARNRALGLAGEKLVLAQEQRRLRAAGCDALADKVVHTSVVEGDGAGYDILSFETDGARRYIEVKTTQGGATTDFYMSANERAFAAAHAPHYVLYRLYGWDAATGSAQAYCVVGTALEDQVAAVPTAFRMTLR